ncbi:trichohyalin-like [Physella acuta]|uniref:trichohyalin-like n=1 Tax=Physella acuta TaxID=109671 RepID=UPI0027DC6F9B|nr:trichohyalin-like [Physella acuta]
MSGSTSIPALIRYAIDYGYEGAALSAFVKQRYQENLEDLHEEEERRKQRYQENLEDLHEEEERRKQRYQENLEDLHEEEERRKQRYQENLEDLHEEEERRRQKYQENLEDLHEEEERRRQRYQENLEDLHEEEERRKQRYQENLEDLHEEEERRRQRHQENLEDLHEEEERRRLDEEERLNELQWEEEIQLKERKWAIEAKFYEFERSEWGSIETIEKQEDEMLKDTSISIAERIIIFKERIKRMTETKARLQMAEQAMLEQLKNMTIEPKPTPATTPDTPTLPDIQNHDATLSHKRDLIKITSPAPTVSSINTTPDAPVDLNYTARQEPRRQNNKPTTVSLIGPMVLPTIGLHTKPYKPLANGKKFADERRIALGPKPRPPTHTLIKQWSKDTGLSYR